MFRRSLFAALALLVPRQLRAALHGGGETISVNTPSGILSAGIAATFTGSYVNGPPASLDYQFDSSGWNAASATISGGTFSFSATAPTAGTHTLSVRDHVNTAILGTSGNFTTQNAAITVITPPTHGAALGRIYTGTYTGTPPTALDLEFNAGGFTLASAPIIQNGVWSFIATAPATGSNTLTVRDHNVTSTSGTSGSFSTVTVLVKNIHNAPAWSAKYQTLGTRVTNASKAYQCVNPGTTTGAPTGTGTSINNGGVAAFKYLSGVDATSLAGLSGGTLSGPTVYQFWNDLPGTTWPSQTLSVVSSASAWATIAAASGESFQDKGPGALGAPNPTNGVCIQLASGNGPALYIQTGFAMVNRLQIFNPGTYINTQRGVFVQNATSAIVSYNIGAAVHHDADQIAASHATSSTGTISVFNNVSLGLASAGGFDTGGTHGITIPSATASDTVAQNTIVRASNYSYGDVGIIMSNYGTSMTIRNNAIFGFGPGVGAASSGDTFPADGHNATDLKASYWACVLNTFPPTPTTIAGSGTLGLVLNVPFSTATFIQPSNASNALDVRPAAASSLIGAGSTVVPSPVNILGRARTAPFNIGAY